MIDLMKFDSELARREGKRVQTSIGNIRETRKLVLRMLKEQVKAGNAREVAKLVGLSKYLRKDLP